MSCSANRDQERKCRRAAIVTHSQLGELHPSEEVLLAALQRQGFDAYPIPWDGHRAIWSDCDVVLLRACWNYHLNLSRFLGWIDSLEIRGILIWNPPPIVRWNAVKTYLMDLERRGVNIIPTCFVEQGAVIDLGNIMEQYSWREAVVKPCVGAGGYKARRVKQGEVARMQRNLDSILIHSGAMVQPFMREALKGELSFVFIAGRYSHTMLRQPGSDHKLERLVEPSRKLLGLAEEVVAAVKSRLLYARVDGLDIGGTLAVMEVELIEPNLGFDLFPPAADTLARALAGDLRFVKDEALRQKLGNV
jgi:glutathione synthase/RimK-type ligase-like ATP-grasp enzyme